MMRALSKLRCARLFGTQFSHLLLALLLLSGCGAYVTGPTQELAPPYDEETLDSLLGNSKQEVQERLKRSGQEILGRDKSYLLYSGSIRASGVGIFVIPMDITRQANVCSLLEFDSDQRLRRFETYGDYTGIATPGSAKSKSCWYAFYSKEELTELRRVDQAVRFERALQGSPDEMYKTAYKLSDPAMAWKLYCLSAHHGHAKARYAVGDYYRKGRSPVSPHSVRAYLWYTLAGDTYNAIQYRDEIALAMTPDQLAEAESLAAEWQPNPAACKTEDVDLPE